MTALAESHLLLHDRYRLVKRLSTTSDFEGWLSLDSEGGQVLVKVWPYEGEQPNEVVRALWDRELRNLFRLSSSPDADSKLVVLRDAGIDKQSRCFVMVLSAPGFETLATILTNRARYDWLRDMRQAEVRVPLWRAVRELAQALGQLHQQQMLHRSLSAQSVLLDSVVGPESMRLGGFEWAVKVGQSNDSFVSPLVAFAPDSSVPARPAHTFESDWYQFGHLAAQLLAGTDGLPVGNPAKDSGIRAKVREASKLTELEQEFLSNLLEPRPELRLSRGPAIIRGIDKIISRLNQPARFVANSYLALTVLLGPNKKLTEVICDLDDRLSPIDTESQRVFIQTDLETPRLISRPGSQNGSYLLQENRLVYLLKEHAEPGAQPSGQWDIAFCDYPGEIRYSSGIDSQVEVRRVAVRVFRVSDLRKDPSIVSKGAISWKPYLPQGAHSLRAKERQERFHEFFRITNQIELLFRDAEIFPYRCVSYSYKDGKQEITLTGASRKRPLPSFAEVNGGLIAFLKLQRAEKRDGDKVYIGPEGSVSMDRQVPLPEF